MNKSEVNIRDVANRAGVSTGTVSRVLSGAPGVKPNNAARVHQAVETLGYKTRGRRPLGSGRAPQRRKTGNLGLYMPIASSQWAGHPMLDAVFQGLDQACAETGFHYLVEFGDLGCGKPRMAVENKVDGLLVKGGVTPWLREACRHFPMVGVNQNLPGLPFDQFNCDDNHSGYLATEHLWVRGHRRIAFLSDISHHPMLLMRYQGYERFMRSHHLFEAALVHLPDTRQTDLSVPETDYAKFDEVLGDWWSLGAARRPTAVVVANDWNAAGLYQTAARLGIGIPAELSVIAFDNTPELCDLLNPGLSSFQVPLDKVAYLAAVHLARKIDEGLADETPVVQSIAGELVQRESVVTIGLEAVGARESAGVP